MIIVQWSTPIRNKKMRKNESAQNGRPMKVSHLSFLAIRIDGYWDEITMCVVLNSEATALCQALSFYCNSEFH